MGSLTTSFIRATSTSSPGTAAAATPSMKLDNGSYWPQGPVSERCYDVMVINAQWELVVLVGTAFFIYLLYLMLCGIERLMKRDPMESAPMTDWADDSRPGYGRFLIRRRGPPNPDLESGTVEEGVMPNHSTW